MNAEQQDDIYLLKLLGAGLPLRTIAKKLGRTEEWVKDRWEALVRQGEERQKSGIMALGDQFSVLAHQYQLVGESLKIVALALANEMPANEIEAMIDGDPKASAERIRTKAIVLRPFAFQPPEGKIPDPAAN